jgi:hypothetical protein
VRDRRAIVVAVAGLVAIVVIVVAAFVALPGTIAAGKINTKGENMVAIASAALTAVGTVVSAYFGIKAANLAREDSDKAAQRHEIRSSELAAATPEEAPAANERATKTIKDLDL